MAITSLLRKVLSDSRREVFSGRRKSAYVDERVLTTTEAKTSHVYVKGSQVDGRQFSERRERAHARRREVKPLRSTLEILRSTCIGANCTGTSGTVTELLVTSLFPLGSLPCPGYFAVYLVYGRNCRRRCGQEAAKWRRKECHFDSS